MSADELKKIRLKVQIWITSTSAYFQWALLYLSQQIVRWLKWAIGIIGIIIGYWLK